MRRRSRSRSTSRTKARKRSRSKARPCVSSQKLWLKRLSKKFSFALFYLATLPGTCKSRREMFTSVKRISIVIFLFCTSLVFSFEALGIRLISGFLGLVSFALFLGVHYLAPKVVVKAEARTKNYSGYSGSAHQRTLAHVYVAHTGYNNADGSPIYGLFAGSYISAK